MARAFIRSLGGVTRYFKPGYNVVARGMRGVEPDDDLDIFEVLGYSKNKKKADSIAAKAKKSNKLPIEIIEYKCPAEDE